MRPFVVPLLALLTLAVAGVLARRYGRRAARRALLRFRARVDRYKFADRRAVTDALLADAEVARAVAAHVAATGEPEADTWARVTRYLDEIVPQFNVLAYYRLGYGLANAALRLFWRPAVLAASPGAVERLPKSSVVVYLVNHRSNADYVLVAWALAGRVAVSYAVGEWARAFPLEFLFKRFGSYFIRRGYREELYHAVLARYVQHITRHGVTQGIFPEGGLTRDGRLRPAKIGLLDYILGVAREDPSFRERLVLVPVGLNYDRVLEDRTLIAELRQRETGAPRPSRLAQAWEVGRFAAWNLARLATGRWRRYGRAAVVVGDPVPLGPWFAAEDARAGGDVLALPKAERLPRVQALGDEMMARIGALVPVTPVPLACAAIQSLGGDALPRERLLERMAAMRDVLRTLNAQLLRADGDIAAVFERAYRQLRMRRVLTRHGETFVVLSRGRELVSWYANSIVPLLGDFAEAVRARDALPVEAVTGPTGAE